MDITSVGSLVGVFKSRRGISLQQKPQINVLLLTVTAETHASQFYSKICILYFQSCCILNHKSKISERNTVVGTKQGFIHNIRN